MLAMSMQTGFVPTKQKACIRPQKKLGVVHMEGGPPKVNRPTKYQAQLHSQRKVHQCRHYKFQPSQTKAHMCQQETFLHLFSLFAVSSCFFLSCRISSSLSCLSASCCYNVCKVAASGILVSCSSIILIFNDIYPIINSTKAHSKLPFDVFFEILG